MPIANTEINSSVVMLANNRYRDEIMTFAAPGTMPAGTLLSRTAAGKMVPYVKGGEGPLGVPVAVTGYELTAAATGDVPFRAIVAGELRKNYLIIAADGDDSNIDNSVLDALRNYGLVALDVHEMGG